MLNLLHKQKTHTYSHNLWMHNPATTRSAQRRNLMYCDKSANEFLIQTVGDSQNEPLSSPKYFRNLII